MKFIRVSHLVHVAQTVHTGILISTGAVCGVLAKAFDGMAKRSQKAALVASTPRAVRP